MNSSQRSEKIYVPIEQVRYISDQLLEQLEAKMQATLPDSESIEESDPIRREISLNLQNYLKSLVDEVAYSMIISNMDTTGRKLGDIIGESQTKYLEPFDLTLNETVRQKYQEWEDYSVQVSQIRQRAPELVNGLYRAGQETYLKQLDERMDQLAHAESPTHQEPEEELLLNEEDELHSSIGESIHQLHGSIDQLPRLRQDITTLNKWAQYHHRRHNKP
ncbi:kinetochore-associated protein Nsl1p [Monosporozyma servazzii]